MKVKREKTFETNSSSTHSLNLAKKSSKELLRELEDRYYKIQVEMGKIGNIIDEIHIRSDFTNEKNS